MLVKTGKLLRNRRGQSLVEYGILVGAIAVVCLAATAMLGHKVGYLIGSTAALLPAVSDSGDVPIFVGKLVKTDRSSGVVRLSSVPGTFSGNLGIQNAEGLVTD